MPRKLVVAAGQMGPASDDKAANLQTVLRLLDEAAGSGAAIISLPELSLTKYFGHWPRSISTAWPRRARGCRSRVIGGRSTTAT